jgi:CheY-like chemotaxis protein
MALKNNFIIIDDDPASIMIAEIVIRKSIPEYSLIKFTNPVLGLQYILEEYLTHPEDSTLLLDINMPGISGWELLDKLAPDICRATGKLKIYMLSSSINPADVEKAAKISFVQGFLTKPFSNKLLLETLETHN